MATTMVSVRQALEQDPPTAAREAGLRYVSDEQPGLSRQRRGRGFSYHDPDGRLVRDRETRRRIDALAIPPAWDEVWICPDPRGHIQSTGRDERGRKQYRYHPRWREVRDETKYHRMLAFGRALPGLRARVEEDLRRHGLPRERVLALVVRLLETTLIRVGHHEYARRNHSFGLTTLRRRHVDIHGRKVEFHFRGKGGKHHDIVLSDRRLAGIVRRCQDLPGYELFQYLDQEGHRHTVEADDVNDYLRTHTGQPFTAKDFRTWAGTVLAAKTFRELGHGTSGTDSRRRVGEAIKRVARRLGNTPAICRKCYVHPLVVEAYLDGTLVETLEREAARELAEEHLDPDEVQVLRFIQQRLKGE